MRKMFYLVIAAGVSFSIVATAEKVSTTFDLCRKMLSDFTLSMASGSSIRNDLSPSGRGYSFVTVPAVDKDIAIQLVEQVLKNNEFAGYEKTFVRENEVFSDFLYLPRFPKIAELLRPVSIPLTAIMNAEYPIKDGRKWKVRSLTLRITNRQRPDSHEWHFDNEDYISALWTPLGPSTVFSSFIPTPRESEVGSPPDTFETAPENTFLIISGQEMKKIDPNTKLTYHSRPIRSSGKPRIFFSFDLSPD